MHLLNEPTQLTQLFLNFALLTTVNKMSLEDVDDTGGYASGKILAYDSEGGGKGGLDATTVKKSLLRADKVLQALDKQSRKWVQ